MGGILFTEINNTVVLSTNQDRTARMCKLSRSTLFANYIRDRKLQGKCYNNMEEQGETSGKYSFSSSSHTLDHFRSLF